MALVLALIALLAIRTYEAMLYLGPLLSLMVMLGKVWRAPARPWLPTLLHLLSRRSCFMISA